VYQDKSGRERGRKTVFCNKLIMPWIFLLQCPKNRAYYLVPWKRNLVITHVAPFPKITGKSAPRDLLPYTVHKDICPDLGTM
jgi:hypothetical protein